MMKFIITGHKSMRFKGGEAVHEYRRYLKEFMREGGRKWINATVISIIPTWSKASRATFQKLALELGTSVPYGPQRSVVDRESLGIGAGRGSKVVEEKDKFYFIYKSTLRYLSYNEYNKAVPGPPPQPFSDAVRFTPYHFQDKGATAWRTHLAKFKLPDLRKFFKFG